jgi:hypothetical protein
LTLPNLLPTSDSGTSTQGGKKDDQRQDGGKANKNAASKKKKKKNKGKLSTKDGNQGSKVGTPESPDNVGNFTLKP